MRVNFRGRPTVDCVCLECSVTFKIERDKPNNGEGLYCSKNCYNAARSLAHPERFWANTDEDINGCLIWRGKPLQRFGYGRLRVNGRARRAHVYAYELTHGPMIPPQWMVCHSCDVRMCVNPSHLFLGTAYDNMRDMASKGRSAGSKRIGELHPMAVISDENAFQILWRFERKSSKVSNIRSLATEFGIDEGIVRNIISGKRRFHAIVGID